MSQYLEDASVIGLFIRQFGLKTKKAVDFSNASSVALPAGVTAGAQVITSVSANAFSVGRQGTTNPGLNVDASVASCVTGLNIQPQASGSGIQISALGGTNEPLIFLSKANGDFQFWQPNTTGKFKVMNSTGAQTAIQLGNTNTDGTVNGEIDFFRGASNSGYIQATSGLNLFINAPTGAGVQIGVNGTPVVTVDAAATGVYIQSTASSALNVSSSASGTNPAFQVDASTASQIAGLKVTGAVAGGTVAISTLDSGSNNNLTIAALGTGTITFNPAVVAAAGGKVSSGIQFGSLNVGVYTGTGAPSFSAMNGSIYVDSNATTTTTRIYVNKSGAGTAGTTWTNLTTAA